MLPERFYLAGAEILVGADLDETIRIAAGQFAALARKLSVEGRTFNVALSGGSTPRRLFQALAAEPAAQYYARIYAEYVAAKSAIGESTEHVSEATFTARIQNMESDAEQKYGRPVRYQVQSRNKEVVLIAVPLP